MKFSWLNNSGNENLIVFFSGWSVEPEHLGFLKAGDLDVVMLHSFNSFEMPEIDMEKYENVTVIAYSLGVFIASVSLLENKFAKEYFAINGTAKPVDNSFGIRKMVFEKTLSNLSIETFDQFQKNMFDNDADFLRFYSSFKVTKTIAGLKKELEFIGDSSKTEMGDGSMFKKAVISTNDRIFPARNQSEFWKNCKNETIGSGHFPFYKFENWSELIELCRK